MRGLARLFAPPPPAVAERCGSCRFFEDDPRRLANALPGLMTLSSADGSVRGDDGLCARHDRFASARGGCGSFRARPGMAGA